MKRRTMGAMALAIFAAGLTLFGCRPERKEAKVGTDGKQYGTTRGTFRHRWWNFEERGRSFLRGGFYDDAIEDLQQAVRQRPEDTPRARTYGMHMVRYFPHRELGIAYLKRGGPGDYELAMKELKISLAQAPTPKANYYLHETYKTYLAKTDADKRPPNLELADVPKSGAAVMRFELDGKADDDYFVDTLKVNDDPVDIPKAQKDVTFAHHVELAAGTSSFRVSALDLAGKSKVRVLSVRQDITGPMLSLKEPRIGAAVQEETLTLRGVIVDPGGVKDLVIAGQKVEFDRTQTMAPFTVTIKLEKGRNMVRFRAIDEAGNVTVGRMPFRYTEAPEVAYLPPLDEEDEGIFWEDAYRGGGVFGTAGPAPDVEVLNLKTGQIVPLKPSNVDPENGGTYVLQVAVAAETTITGITVNEREVSVPEMENVFFTQRIPMSVGDVTVRVQAKDKEGRDGTQTLKVKAEVPKVLDTENRLALAPLPFRNQLEEKARLKTMAFDGHLLKAFTDARRFRIVDRTEEALQRFLDEQKLAETEFVDSGTAIETGKLFNAEYIVLGALVEDQSGAEVLGKIVSVETGEIVATPQVYGLARNLAETRKLATDFADGVTQELPLISGEVKVKGSRVAISKGANAGLKSGAEVIVFRYDPDWGEEAPPDEVALARIQKVGKSLSFVEVVKPIMEGGEVKDGDHFVTK